jgi:hypothetical protein
MFKSSSMKCLRRAFGPASIAALLLATAAVAGAQETPPAPPAPAQTPQTQPQQQSRPAEAARADVADSTVTAKAAADAVAPLYSEYRGVKLGMTAAEVRAKLGDAEEKSDAMDFFVFSNTERARVYYQDGKASAIIATYIGRDAQAPAPVAVLGTEIEAKADGSMYKMTMYPQAGYWVAYSRTAGDSPLVIITMQKSR